jgi:uridine kinase
MSRICPPEFKEVADQISPNLLNLPGKILAIDGRDGVGKTTLGRFLAWYFNVSLVETDLFWRRGEDGGYELAQIRRLVTRRLSIPRPIIVEGITVLEILQSIRTAPDILVYVERSDWEGSESLRSRLVKYETDFSPKMKADISLSLTSSEEI